MSIRATVQACVFSAATLLAVGAHAQAPFQLEEASIADMHAAIKSGATTCTQIMQSYVARARAYNGTCSALVTSDGAAVPAATGAGARRRAADVPDANRRDHRRSCPTSPSTKATRPSGAGWRRPHRTRASCSSTAWSLAFRTPAK